HLLEHHSWHSRIADRQLDRRPAVGNKRQCAGVLANWADRCLCRRGDPARNRESRAAQTNSLIRTGGRSRPPSCQPRLATSAKDRAEHPTEPAASTCASHTAEHLAQHVAKTAAALTRTAG